MTDRRSCSRFSPPFHLKFSKNEGRFPWPGDGLPNGWRFLPLSSSIFRRSRSGPCPTAPSKIDSLAPYGYYMLPLGLWQCWSMFAPNPLRENKLLEAEVVYAKKLIHIYKFAKIGDLSPWQKLGRYRDPKFTDNIRGGGRPCTRCHRSDGSPCCSPIGPRGNSLFLLTVSLYTKVNEPRRGKVRRSSTRWPPLVFT